jgi:hypothetical protein
MKKGQESVVPGLMNKAQVLVSGILPDSAKAELGRKQNEPGSGQ